MCSAETWSATEANQKRLETFYHNCPRRLLKIARRDKVRNETARETAGQDTLEATVWHTTWHTYRRSDPITVTCVATGEIAFSLIILPVPIICYTAWVKNKTPNSCPYILRSPSIDRFSNFLNCYSLGNFAIKRSLQIPPHLNGVATLPCEILMSDNISCPICCGTVF